ncbi:hypothetical protein [Lentimicrobium sp.]|uniref:hypothetical protein n=1 Tax=Lentimicrobium sp. TaxID=2034841 RepID=UPI002C88BEA2|nr:hypothetical protein [Lentimicrobium sp.]HPF65700.1 hypothetical protein [Lentimicrobium sp.]
MVRLCGEVRNFGDSNSKFAIPLLAGTPSSVLLTITFRFVARVGMTHDRWVFYCVLFPAK